MDRRPTRRQVLQATGGTILGGALLSGTTSDGAAQQAGEGWRQFGYDAANTGHAPTNTGPVADIRQQWRYETGDWVDSSPAVANGTVYVGSDDGNVYALDAGDGTEQWRYETGGPVDSSPAVADGTVYVRGGDDDVYALDATDGSEQWRYGTGSGISSPTVTDSTIYVVEYGNVYALDATDGTEQWHYETRSAVLSSPAVADGTVYVGSVDDHVYALDATDGTEQWQFEIGDDVESSPAVADGTVYVGSDDGNVYALDATDGTEQWRFDTGYSVDSSPAVADGTVYVGSADTNLYALDVADGSEQWRHDTRGPVDSSPAVANGTVYVGSGDDNVYALDAADGTEQWRYETSDSVESSPAVADGTVYVGSRDGLVYGLTGETPPTSTPTDTPTPTPTDTPTPTPTDTPTPTETPTTTATESAQQDGGIGLLPVAAGLGALGLGGGGALWLARSGTDSGDDLSGGQTTVQSDERPPPDSAGTDTTTEDESGDSLPAAVKTAVETGDSHRDTAREHLDAREYDRALEAFTEAREAYETAQKRATEYDIADTDDIDVKIQTVADGREKVHRQRLSAQLDILRNRIPSIDDLENRDDLDRAKETLESLEADLGNLHKRASDRGLDSLAAEVDTVRQHRVDCVEAIEQRPRVGPPASIPRAPDLDVNFEALTDEEPLGGGGNADVTKATLPTPDGDVTLAIKKPRMNGTLHSEQIDRLLAEAETWDKLDDHDHIVGVVDYDSDPLPWIAMEYMDAGHLGERADELEPDQALWTAIAITKGVRHAHRRGIAHLDLKPRNILFRSIEDAWDAPKVADWGLSKHLLEHSKSIDGLTVEYAAPEQFDDDYGATDDITDVYQLGAVFYELFTGRPPFEGQPFEVIDQLKNDQPAPPSELANVPEALDDVLLTALAKQKTDRYDNVAYLRDALEEIFDTSTE